MKRYILILIPAIILASCGGKGKNNNSAAELEKLKKQRSEIDQKIASMETKNNDSSKKATPVSIVEVQPMDFVATVNVQSQITGDENVLAVPQAGGIVSNILVHPGDHVKKGQVLATLDAANIESQIKAQEAQLSLIKALYEKQQKLWAQNIGTEVQLLQAKANYTSQTQQLEALKAQRNMYRIVSPINGVVDNVPIKIGDAVGGLVTSGIRVVSFDKFRAEANLGENYLGKIHQGDRVNIIFPDMNDSIQSKLSYVGSSVDPNSRAFLVQVRLGNNSKLRPNMSCIMKITDYESKHALVVPISVIQKTGKGELLYIADGNKAKAVYVKTGQNNNGQVEILSGLNPGDKVITAGFEDLDNGDPITNLQ